MKRNRKWMNVLCFALALIVGVGFTAMVSLDPAAAAGKKTVYVVKSIKITENGKTTMTKVKYNKNRTLKSIYDPRKDETMTFKYGKEGQIKSFKDAYGARYDNWTEKRFYTWKKGKLTKIKGSRGGDDTFTYTFKYKKGKIVSSKDVEKWKDNGGGSRTLNSKYTYKKGHITRSDNVDKEGKSSYKSKTIQKLDKKGNVISVNTTQGSKRFGGYYKAKIKYKKGRVSSMKTVDWIPPYGDNIPKCTKQITYKKIKVKDSLVKKVKAQQWKLVNISNTLTDFAW